MISQSTRHGLSVLTAAHSNQRLQRPVPTEWGISNCFNDATSGADYIHSAGHEGIDFACPTGTPVRAMYDGEVVGLNFHETYRPQGDYPETYYGLWVEIESDLGNGKGFRHRYAHLAHSKDFLKNPDADARDGNFKEGFEQSHHDQALKKADWNPDTCTLRSDTFKEIRIGDRICQGQQIGLSGATGTEDPHLHVHLKPYDNSTPPRVTSDDNPAGCHAVGYPDSTKETVVAHRIQGCMNYACFLPFDTQKAVSGHTHVPASITAEILTTGTGQLLSPRDAYARIPVYREGPPENGQFRPGTAVDGTKKIDGKYVACYAVLDTYQDGQGNNWYRIQYETATVTDPGTRWVPERGQVNRIRDVVWVHVEDYSLETLPALSPAGSILTGSTAPSIYSIPSEVENQQLGTLFQKTRYRMVGEQTDWRQIHLKPGWRPNQGVTGVTTGWVQASSVRTCGDLSQVREVDSPGTSVTRPPAPYLQIRVENLRLRTGPSTDDTILVASLPVNEYYAILAQAQVGTDQWWQIRFNDTTEGWVAGHEPRHSGNAYVRVWPGAPTGLEAAVSGSSVILRWTAPTVPEASGVARTMPGLTGYRIWRGTSPQRLVRVYRVGSAMLSLQDPTPGPLGTLYYYAVSTLRSQVEGPHSEPANIVTGVGTLTGGTELYTVARPGVSVSLQDNPGTSETGVAVSMGVLYPVQATLKTQLPSVGVSIQHLLLSLGTTRGWVPRSAMELRGADASRQLEALASPQYLRVASGMTGLYLRTGPSTAFAAYRLLTDTDVWYEVVGQTETTPVWYQIQYSTTFRGWVHSAYVTLSVAAAAVPDVTPALPEEAGPAGEAATGTGSTSGSASGDFRNLVTNPDGRWAVWKSGTTVTANFSSPRSPVQYYARQNPQPQFGLPVGFRPTSQVTHTVTGTRVNEDRTPVVNAQPAPFDLTIGTDGEMRYVNNAKVDHLGYVSYSVTHLQWETAEALVTSPATGTLSANGTYLNQQVNWGSSWTLSRSRSGTRVTGSFGSTRSPVDYYANGASRAAQLRLPTEYRPTANTRFQVTGAIRVNTDGSDSTDTRRVDFWLAVRPNGEMWYDADANLQTLGVGYLRYTVDVSWTAAPLVPTAPQDLETDDVEATALALDWRSPAADGGADIEGYRIQVWDADDAEWDNEEADTEEDDTAYDVEDLDPYTTYTFRVAARNSAGWGDFGPALTVTTPRAAPGAPASLTAAATHDTVTLTWGSATGTVTGHTLERKVGNGSWRPLVTDTGETTRAWEDRTVAAATSYHYRVAAHNHGVTGNWSDTYNVTTAAAPTIPGPPTGLSVAPGTDRRLQLSWTAPTDTGGGVTGYQVERSPDATPRVWATIVADTGSATLTWGDDDVAPDTVVHYRVSARNSAGVGMPSAEAQGQSRPQLPLAADAAYPLTAHAEPRTDASVTATFAAYLPGRSYDLVAQVPGTDGWWQVLLFGPSTQGPFWLPAVAGSPVGDTAALPQVPGGPQNLTAVPGSGAVDLTWSAPVTGGTVTGYRLWRRTGTAAFATLGSDLDATVLTHADSTAVAGTDYEYRVQALSAVSPGPWTNAISTAEPNAPTALVATPATDSQMTLTWTAPTTGSPVTGYRIERAADTDPLVWTDVEANTGDTDVTWNDSDLTAATVYHYRVTARSAVGLGTVSAVVETQTRPQATLKTTATYPVQAHAWPATEAPVTHTWDRHDATVQLDVAGQVAGTSGWWRVLRFGASASGPYWVSAAAVTVTGATTHVPEAPGLPTALTATATHDSVTLTWSAPTTGGTVTGYRLWHQTGTETWTVLFEGLLATAVSYTDSFLTAETTYQYRLQALSAAGAGTRTAAVSATTDAVQVPDAPTALAAVPGADSQMVLTWTMPMETGTHAISGYRIERAVDATMLVWADAEANTGNTDLAWSDSDLAADTLYHYRVRAVSAAGEGASSAVAEGRTRSQMVLKATATYPVQAHARPATEASITHTWAAHDATVKLDVVGRVSGTDGWWRVLRFGASASGPYWVSAAFVTVTGATANVPEAPGLPTALAATATQDSVILTWSAPTTGGTVTGYRLWRQTGAEAFAVLGSDLAAATLTHTDTDVTAGTTYQYQVQALAAAGAGPRTAVVRVTPAAVTPLVHNYGQGNHTLDIPAGYQTLHIQLCGGAGGGGGAHVDDQYSGEFGGHGGCTFASFSLVPGDTWTLAIGRGGAGGTTDEDDPDDGRNGTASFLRRNGSTVATGDYGHGGEAAVGWYQRAAAGATSGASSSFPAAWPGDATAPSGGRRGAWFLDRDGYSGAAGLARVLLV